MKATEKFDLDFRPQNRSRHQEECKSSQTLLSSSDVLMKTKLTFVRYGLIPTFSNLQNPTHYELHYN